MRPVREIINGRRTAWLFILVAVLVLFILTRSQERPSIDFLAGPVDSTFYLDAQLYKEALAVHGVDVNIIETAGTIENLQRLIEAEEPTAGFADAVQGIRDEEEEVLEEEAAPGEEAEESKLESISSLGAMYLQPLWVFLPEGTDIEDLRGLSGRRVTSGWEGSSARLLAALVMESTGIDQEVTFTEADEDHQDIDAESALAALRSGEVAALLFMGQPDAPLIDGLLRAPDVNAIPIQRAEAYALHFPFLKAVRLPEGGYDLAANIPEDDLQLVAASTELLVSNMFPAPLADLLLEASNEIHGGSSLFSGKHEFPNPDMVSIPLNLSADRYYKEGPPMLRKVLPFQWATWIDRFLMVLVGFGSAAVALFSVIPKLIELSFNRNLETVYRQIEAIEKSLNGDYDRDTVLSELDALERQSADFKILMRSMIAPYMEMRQNLHDLRERVAG